MAINAGIRLEFSDKRPALTAVADINAALREAGTGAWPLDLSGAPAEIRRLIRQPTLTEAETEQVRTYFLLPRARLLQIIEAAGRTPNVSGGGELTTLVANQGYGYPQLWVVQSATDYTRFDRFHVNVSEDGVGVDEVLQVLFGSGIVVRLRLPDRSTRTLTLDCLREDAGWLVTYDGGRPHMGSLSKAAPGTKIVVQAIGPARWALRNLDPD